jgi:heme/copper-type cytochrome/quinol oxidase subunit 3
MSIETESPAVNERNVFVGARLLLAADGFLFLAFLFAYAYLRALNSDGMWHPSGVNPSTGLGAATTVVVIAAAAVAFAAVRQARIGPAAPGLAWGVVALLTVAAVLALVQTFDPGFSPHVGGGFGSVFVGFTAAYAVHLLGAVYWSEVVAATATRSPSSSDAADLAALSAFVIFLAGVMVIAFVLVYLV